VDSCTSLLSATASVTLKPKPAPPNISVNSPVCSGQTAVLSVLNPKVNHTYFWTGPNGNNSLLATYEIPTVDSVQHSGFYYCRTTLDGCTSEQSEGIPLVVNVTPKLPLAFSTSTPLCIGQAQTLRLEVSPDTTAWGVAYQWFSLMPLNPLAPPSASATFQTSNLPSVLQPGVNNFYVVATRNNCSSGPSLPVSIWADTIPASTAFAGPDLVACDTTPFVLNAVMPTVGGGIWTLVSGSLVNIVNPNSDSTLVRKATPGGTYTFAWTISAGACKNYSTDQVEVKVNVKQTAISPAVITLCAATEAELSATQGSPVTGYWKHNIQGQGDLIQFEDSLKTNTKVGPLVPRTVYFFTWNIAVPGCPVSSSLTALRNLSEKPSLGPDVFLCSSMPAYQLKAPDIHTGAYPETGLWYSPDPGLAFQSPNSLSTLVSGLKPGPNTVIWQLNNGLCGADSRDTLIINYGPTPVLTDDTFTVPYGTPVIVDVLANDILPTTSNTFILINPLRGKIDTISQGVYRYQPTNTFSGTDIAYYRVCNFICPDTTCATASITFNVQENVGCAIPTVITPNGDGLNDAFVVRCQQGEAPILEVTIFNQWGDEVFNRRPYLNDWQGTNSGGEDLPVGTYYVVIDYHDGTRPYAGFLMIQR
jgi:gliding motility-associated-like protein